MIDYVIRISDYEERPLSWSHYNFRTKMIIIELEWCDVPGVIEDIINEECLHAALHKESRTASEQLHNILEDIKNTSRSDDSHPSQSEVEECEKEEVEL